MRTPKYLFFSLEEYKQRMEALRSRMEDKGVDCMLVTTPENLYYLSGYQTPGYYWFQTLIVPMSGEPVFVTRLTEASNIEPLSWVEESRPYQDHEDWIVKTRDALTDMGMGNKRIGLEYGSWFFTVRDHLRLTGSLPNAQFVDCSGLVEQERLIKSPQEIEYIRQAAKAAEDGLRAGIEAAVVGATENDVAAEVHRAQILAGSEYTGLPIFTCIGPRSFQTHATWNRNVLEPNQVVFFEIPGCINRYHAAMMRHVYLGDPPELLIRSTEVGKRILSEAKSQIKPGVKAGDVYELVQRSIEEADLGYKMDRRAAYSIGIAFAPDWGEGHILSITRGEERTLQAGMTFHLIAAGMKIPSLGKVNLTDTILLTDKGCETLTDGLEHKIYVK